MKATDRNVPRHKCPKGLGHGLDQDCFCTESAKRFLAETQAPWSSMQKVRYARSGLIVSFQLGWKIRPNFNEGAQCGRNVWSLYYGACTRRPLQAPWFSNCCRAMPMNMYVEHNLALISVHERPDKLDELKFQLSAFTQQVRSPNSDECNSWTFESQSLQYGRIRIPGVLSTRTECGVPVVYKQMAFELICRDSFLHKNLFIKVTKWKEEALSWRAKCPTIIERVQWMAFNEQCLLVFAGHHTMAFTECYLLLKRSPERGT